MEIQFNASEWGNVSVWKELKRQAYQKERDGLAIMEAEGNFESLATDTMGYRTKQWFIDTQKPFFTGIATTCLVVALIDDEYGMGASHRDPFTAERQAKRTQDMMTRIAEGRHPSQHEIEAVELKLADEEIISLTHRVIDESIRQFSFLNPPNGFPTDSTRLYMIGLQYAEPNQIEIVQSEAIKRLIHNAQKILPSNVKRQVQLSLFNHVGKKGGFAYDGKDTGMYNF